MNYCESFMEPEELKFPDKYSMAINGHWVDVDNSQYDHDRIILHFTDEHGKEVAVHVTAKDAKDLRKELKAAITLVKIADDY